MISKPTLLIDEEKARLNIWNMVSKAKDDGIQFRPHFKTHQSHEIASWFREAGVEIITVSSLEMAAYFANDGWNNITVAFPVNVLELEAINELAKSINLNLLVESKEVIQMLNKNLVTSVNVFVKVDLGTKRTGIPSENIEEINDLIQSIQDCENLSFMGFLGHAGHSYNCRSKSEILSVHNDCINQLNRLRAEFSNLPNLHMSYGDTPTCSIAESFDSIDELRPGNFVFYDLMQEQIGSCGFEDISVAMACPIVAKHIERNEVVIYGGGVHFSKDRIEKNDQVIYGQVVESAGDKWNAPINGVLLVRVSQEHGIIKAPSEWINSKKVGDIVKILPVHSCMTMDLMRHRNVQMV